MVVKSCRNFYYAIGKKGKPSNLHPCHEGKSCDIKITWSIIRSWLVG
jgi:hypothetical protein